MSSSAAEGRPAYGEALRSSRRLIAPLALAQFICSFAGSNMNVMINDISDDLNTDVKGVQTVITLFLLTMAILMIPCSKLTDRWGRKRCFIGGLTLYGIGAFASSGARAVEHNDAIYLIDSRGRERAILHSSDPPNWLVDDLRTLIAEGAG